MDKTLDNYKIYDDKQKLAIDRVKSNIDKWLFFTGTSGTGKDYIADCILRYRQAQHRNVFKVNAIRLLLQFQNKFLESIDFLDWLKTQDLIIINEIEKYWSTASGKEKEILFEIIDNIYTSDRQLIIISNLTWNELRDNGILTSAISDRFAEKGEMVEFNWESYRRKNFNSEVK